MRCAVLCPQRCLVQSRPQQSKWSVNKHSERGCEKGTDSGDGQTQGQIPVQPHTSCCDLGQVASLSGPWCSQRQNEENNAELQGLNMTHRALRQRLMRGEHSTTAIILRHGNDVTELPPSVTVTLWLFPSMLQKAFSRQAEGLPAPQTLWSTCLGHSGGVGWGWSVRSPSGEHERGLTLADCLRCTGAMLDGIFPEPPELCYPHGCHQPHVAV